MQFPRNLTTVCLVFLTILSLALPQLTAASASFPQNLQLRDTGDDVTRLQQFLNAEHFLIAQSGPGSPGNETSIFGLRTYQALTQFQSAHGLPTTGFFGPLTRALITTLAPSSTGTSTSPSSVGTSTPALPQLPALSPLSSTTSGYVPGVTPLPGYKPGQLIFIGGGASTPATPPAPTPAPTPYVAKAVHFDGAASLINNAISSVDNGTISFAGWIRLSTIPAGPFTFGFGPVQTFWVSDPLGAYVNSLSFDADSNLPAGTLDIGGGFSTNDFASYVNYDAQWNYSSPGAWAHIMGTFEINHAQGQKLAAIYITDTRGTDVTALVSSSPEDDGPSAVAALNGLPFYFGDNGSGGSIVGDVADWWVAPGISLLDSNGNIPEATRRKFISADGKPVDLGSNCSGPTGTAPAVCFTGDASTFGTNQGTGGAFTLSGILTDAGTSPSN